MGKKMNAVGNAMDTCSGSTATISSAWTTTSDKTYFGRDTGGKSENDLFKQISSLLGLKIINIQIEDSKVTLICRRNKKLFKVEIANNNIIVKDKNDEIISEITLLADRGIYISPNIYPSGLPPKYPDPNSPNTAYPNTTTSPPYLYRGWTITDKTDKLVSNKTYSTTNETYNAKKIFNNCTE